MSLLAHFNREPAVGDTPATSRRDRAANAGSVMLMNSLGQKVLHGWLQNRHQVLVPLTLNLRVLSDQQRSIVASALAGLLLAGRPRAEAEVSAPALRAWLHDLGADPASLAVYDQAMLTPPSFDQIMERTLQHSLPVYTYMAGLRASDARFPASMLLCDVLEARFELPTPVVRSITRRHRR